MSYRINPLILTKFLLVISGDPMCNQARPGKVRRTQHNRSCSVKQKSDTELKLAGVRLYLTNLRITHGAFKSAHARLGLVGVVPQCLGQSKVMDSPANVIQL